MNEYKSLKEIGSIFFELSLAIGEKRKVSYQKWFYLGWEKFAE
jgi:hypothetical protein